MALPRPPLNPAQRIPNNPFYSPESNALVTPLGPLIVGSGLTINYSSGTINSSGGGGGGTITSIVGGTGITVTSPFGPTPSVALAPAGVVSGTYSYPSSFTIDQYGRITSVVPSAGAPSTTVTSPITNTGTALNPVIGIQDGNLLQKGAVRVGANICSAAGVISVCSSSTTQSGIVQLNNTVTSTSTTEALTAAQGKALQDQISASLIATNLTLAGTLDAASGLLLTVTSDGTAAGLTVGNPLPAPAAGNTDYFVIVTVPGIYPPPGGGGPYTASQGDWFVSTGTVWQYYNTGADLPIASTGTAGIVQLATALQTQTGTNTTAAVTPAAAAATYIPLACLSAKGAIVGASAAGVAIPVTVGTNGQVLTACSASASGICWSTPDAAIPCSLLTAKGALITTATPTTPVALFPGADGTVLTACSLSGNGLCWATTPYIPCSIITGKGSLITGSAANTPLPLAPGLDGQGLIADSACTLGLKWGNVGGVTSISTGTGLTGGPITTSGTIALANTAVTPGSYTNASLTVDAQGRLTAASSGAPAVTALTGVAPIAVTTGAIPTISIAASSTTASGAVQLYDNTNSTSTTLALTAAQGKNLQDQITSLANASNIELAGTIDASTGLLLSVTSVGTADGYTVGSALPAASSTTNNTYVIVTTPGTLTPPGGSATVATRGDWFLVSETSPGVFAWTFLNVGFDAPAATTTVAGITCLSTNALAQAGTDTTTALTPAAAASAYVPLADYTAKGDLLSATGANTPVALSVGTNGQVLVACSTAATGLCWVTIPAASPATPTVSGTVLGCTTATNTALGCNALVANTTGTNNVAIGLNAGCSNTTGCQSVYIGQNAGCAADTNFNVVIGAIALCSGPSTALGVTAVGAGALRVATGFGGQCSTAIGVNAGCQVTSGVLNTLLGATAGGNITTGNCNVIIGNGVNAASATGSCQLAIGFSATDNWLTGTSTKAIRPGAGIIDCTGSCGCAGQGLVSRGAGNAVVWAVPTPEFVQVGIYQNGLWNGELAVPYWCTLRSNFYSGASVVFITNGDGQTNTTLVFPVNRLIRMDVSLRLDSNDNFCNNLGMFGLGCSYGNGVLPGMPWAKIDAGQTDVQVPLVGTVCTATGLCAFNIKASGNGNNTAANYGSWMATFLN